MAQYSSSPPTQATLAKAGKKLGDLHVDYEQAQIHDVSFVKGSLDFEGNAENRQDIKI